MVTGPDILRRVSDADLPGPAYRIVTSRTVVRCWSPADAPLLDAAIRDNLAHLKPWMPWAHQEPQTLEQRISLLRMFRGQFDLGQDHVYGIFDRDETRVIGGTGLHLRLGPDAREIGYWIVKDCEGRGMVSEAVGALTRVAFEIDRIVRVEIHCDPENVRSAAVPRRLDYTHEGTLRQRVETTGDGRRDSMIWSLLGEEYPNSPSSSASLEAFDAAGRRLL